MTIQTCMNLVDTMAPVAVGNDVKLRFLGEIEGRVRVELLGEDPAGILIPTAATPVTLELCVPHPFDQLYWMYVLAMLFHMSGDIARYENAALLFNAAYQNYGKWLKRKGE